ncbi:IclR family transcriptional regulator [Bordetella genomosp. 10]|uniref:IclR family transcriptional regulator n=1 Tax=Bordetella genomosp. 10 TaxID=1416804 RepID=A0A261SJN6_9BORD|nr:helix-turn-helix domain-containing protein [Bordetella genomosp. 10]OZI37624.1 IclR family transcriptional regulator [Bordetella genomosp. 10]
MNKASSKDSKRRDAAGLGTRGHDGGPRTLRRGLHILGALRRAGGAGLHVTEIAAQTGMQRSTVYRFLDVLVDEGYALRDGRKPRYRVLQAEAGDGDPHEQAIRRWRPAMRRISDALGDSVFLICRAGDDSLCLHREIGNYPVQVLAVTVGHRQPLGVGAAGLALLAALPPAEAADIIARNETALRAYGGLTAPHIRRLVESTRDRGWSVIGNAAVPGVLGVGMAWCDAEGYPRLAISLSTLIDRMPAARQRTVAEVLRAELAKG